MSTTTMSDPAPKPTAQLTSHRLKFSNYSVLTKQTVEILESSKSIETGLVGQYGDMTLNLRLSNKHSYQIPEVITSKETLHFLGFTPFEVEQIWSDITPVRGIYKWVEREFIQGILTWIGHKITDIKWLDDAGELKGPKELLDYLGLRNEVQLQILKLNSLPERGGVRLFCLQQLHSECVLVWAKRYLARRLSFLEQLDELICSYDDRWRLFIIEELSERPIDSMVAFSDTIIPIPIQRLGFDGF